MVRIGTILTLGLIGLAAATFIGLGGASGIGARIGGGFRAFGESIVGEIGKFNVPEINLGQPAPTLQDVPDLAVPFGTTFVGLPEEVQKRAFRITTPRGFLERSVGTRPILHADDLSILGKKLPPRAVALRIPTFVGVVSTSTGGTRTVAGSKALFERIQLNLSR